MSYQGTYGYCVNLAICSPEVDKSADRRGFFQYLTRFHVGQVVLALAVRYLFYEDWEENIRIRKQQMEELERKFDNENSESDSVSVDTNTSERSTLRPHNHEMDRSSNSTGETTIQPNCATNRPANLTSHRSKFCLLLLQTPR